MHMQRHLVCTRSKLPRVVHVCAQVNMILGDITNTANTAAHPARTASKVHSKQMDDENSCENSCDHLNPYNSCDNPCNNWCAGTQPIATERAAAFAAARAAAALAALAAAAATLALAAAAAAHGARATRAAAHAARATRPAAAAVAAAAAFALGQDPCPRPQRAHVCACASRTPATANRGLTGAWSYDMLRHYNMYMHMHVNPYLDRSYAAPQKSIALSTLPPPAAPPPSPPPLSPPPLP